MKQSVLSIIYFITTAIGVILLLSEPMPGQIEWDPTVNIIGMGVAFLGGYLFKKEVERIEEEG